MARKKQTEDDGDGDGDGMSLMERRVRQLRDIVSNAQDPDPAYHIDKETDTMWMATDLVELMVMTMRFAMTMRGAPKNCRNSKCRTQGCQLRIAENGDGVCPGGMTMADVDTAALMLAYLVHFARRYAPWAFAALTEKS